MSRWSASGIHFLLSLVILSTALLLMRLFWYPGYFFQAIGADGLLMILFMVDVTLGPLITLIIFKSGKKGLKLDLAVIAVCQLAALLYGMYTVFIARPAFVVFNENHFEVVQAFGADLNGARYSEFESTSWNGPRWAVLRLKNSDGKFKPVFSETPFSYQARYFVPYDEAKSEPIPVAWSIKRLRQKNKSDEANKKIDDFLAASVLHEDQIGYLPLVARAEHMAVMISLKNGDVLGVLRLNPW